MTTNHNDSSSEPESRPRYRRWRDGEAVIADSFPMLTANEPYWADLPRAEVVNDPHRGRTLKLLSGDVPPDVLDAACDLIGHAGIDVGDIVGINHSPVTGYLSIDTYGEHPAYDARYISEWDLTAALLADASEPGTLSGLADRIEHNAAAVASQLRSFSAAGFGLADLDLPFLVLSRLGWPADQSSVETITTD